MLKYRSSSSSSLPRNATDIEQTYSGERKFATSSRLDLSLHTNCFISSHFALWERDDSPLSMSLDETGPARVWWTSRSLRWITRRRCRSSTPGWWPTWRKWGSCRGPRMPLIVCPNRGLSWVTPYLSTPAVSLNNYSEQSISVIKKKFEAELADWKRKQDESQNEIAQLKIDLGNSNQANKQLQVKYDNNPSVSLISSFIMSYCQFW